MLVSRLRVFIDWLAASIPRPAGSFECIMLLMGLPGDLILFEGNDHEVTNLFLIGICFLLFLAGPLK